MFFVLNALLQASSGPAALATHERPLTTQKQSDSWGARVAPSGRFESVEHRKTYIRELVTALAVVEQHLGTC